MKTKYPIVLQWCSSNTDRVLFMLNTGSMCATLSGEAEIVIREGRKQWIITMGYWITKLPRKRARFFGPADYSVAMQ